MSIQWPVTLTAGPVVLRALTRRDATAWYELRSRNSGWLRPWEATLPAPDPAVPTTYRGLIRSQAREARSGRSFSFGIDYRGELAGQITLGGIAWGSLRSAYIGYWIDSRRAGRGIMPTSVALLSDYAFDTLGLHRVEINIRPENASSRRVAAKVGYRYEGLRRKYLHIDGDWRDHLSYVMLAGDRPPGGLLRDLRENGWKEGRIPNSDESPDASRHVTGGEGNGSAAPLT